MKLTFDRPIVFFDTETTGVVPATDRIVSIAVRKYTAVDQFEDRGMLLNPGVSIPAGATKVHGITDDMVAEKPKFTQIAKSLFQMLEGCDIGGYNVLQFDIPLLAEEFHRAGIQWPVGDFRVFDSCAIFKKKEERTLTAAVKFFLGEDLEEAHDAHADTEASARVFFAQLDRYEDLKDMTEDEVSAFCMGDQQWVDLAGVFILNEEDKVVFRFGKHIGEEVTKAKHSNYIDWMLKQDTFTNNTKTVATRLIK